jgi:photosystem II stability/assembly factor-like uncharacterized protein
MSMTKMSGVLSAPIALVAVLSLLVSPAGALRFDLGRQGAVVFQNVTWNPLGPGNADWNTAISITDDGTVYAGFDIGGLYRSSDHGDSWVNLNGPLTDTTRTKILTNYCVLDVVRDPQRPETLWAATIGGVFRSTSAGISWSAVRDGLGPPHSDDFSAPVSSLVLDPADPEVVYAGVGDSHNWRGGQGTVLKRSGPDRPWERKQVGSKDNIIARLAIKDSETLYAATAEGIFKSVDAGETWKSKSLGETIAGRATITDTRFVALAPNGDLYATARPHQVTLEGEKPYWVGGVYRSRDGGDSWNNITSGLPFSPPAEQPGGSIDGDFYHWLSIDPRDSNVVYVANDTWLGSSGVYKTTNATSDHPHWTKMTKWEWDGKTVDLGWAPNTHLSGATVAVDPTNPDRVYMGSSAAMLLSEDGGGHWQSIYSAKATSIPETFRGRGLNVFGAARAVAIDPTNPRIIYLGTGDHGLLKSEDSGLSWRSVINRTVPGVGFGADVPSLVIDPLDSNIIWAADDNFLGYSGGGVVKSTDGGQTWRQTTEELAYVNCIVADFSVNPRRLYAATGTELYRSIDGGESWEQIVDDRQFAPGQSISFLLLNPARPKTLYVTVSTSDWAEPGGLWETPDATAPEPDWRELKINSSVVDVRGLASSSDGDRLYAGVRSHGSEYGGLWASEDAGKTWHHALADPWIQAVAVLPGNDNILYAATRDDNFHDDSAARGVYRSDDAGQTWRLVNDGFDVLNFLGLDISASQPARVYAGSNGGAFYFADDPGLVITSPPVLAAATEGEPYSRSLQVSGGSGTGFEWDQQSQEWPSGLALSVDGVISGTPAKADTYDLDVRVSDSNGRVASVTLRLVVTSAEPHATS